MSEKKDAFELNDEELEKVTGGVQDMEDIASDMVTDLVYDESDGSTHVVPERKYKPAQPHRSPVPRKRQR